MVQSLPSPVKSPFSRFAAKPANSSAKPAGGQGAAGDFQDNTHLIRKIVTIDLIRKVSESWAFAVGKDLSGAPIKLTGQEVVPLEAQETYEVHGTIQSHPKHGESLVVSSAIPHIEPNPESILKFIRKSYKNVGIKTAIKLLDERVAKEGGNRDLAMEKLRDDLIKAPYAIDWSGVTGRPVEFDEDAQTAMDGFIQRDFATRIGGGHHVTTPALKGLVRWAQAAAARAAADGKRTDLNTGDQCWAVFVEDPFAPLAEVDGYGWVAANSIGKALNIARDDERRLRALVNEAVNRYCESRGHTYLTESQVVESIKELDPLLDAAMVLEFALREDAIIFDDSTDLMEPPRYYARKLRDDEEAIATSLAMMARPVRPLLRNADKFSRERIDARLQAIFADICPGGVLDQGQLDAIYGILTTPSRVMTLTGGPGCGKTSIMEVLVEVLKDHDLAFAAPTGIAAKILQSRIGARRPLEASTVHSMLGGDGKTFRVNKENPIQVDLLVIDETSMLDNNMAKAILHAAREHCRIVFIGDPNQLSSIGPGNFLSDLIRMPSVFHAHLSVVHRNKGEILEVVHETAAGELSMKDGSDVRFARSLSEDDIINVINDYIASVERNGYESVGLLMSKRQGKVDEQGWNTTWFNAKLKSLCNPTGEKIPGCSFNVGDRVMVLENLLIKQRQFSVDSAEAAVAARVRINRDGNPEERVVNGDTGTIVGYTPFPKGSTQIGAEWLKLKLDDGRLIDFTNNAIESLQVSYARTVHKSQGGQFKHVISVITPGVPEFINRSTMFTAFSRAKKRLDVYGSPEVIRKVVATPPPARNSGLVDRTRFHIDVMNAMDDERVDDPTSDIFSDAFPR